jgi:hypothetical protein
MSSLLDGYEVWRRFVKADYQQLASEPLPKSSTDRPSDVAVEMILRGRAALDSARRDLVEHAPRAFDMVEQQLSEQLKIKRGEDPAPFHAKIADTTAPADLRAALALLEVERLHLARDRREAPATLLKKAERLDVHSAAMVECGAIGNLAAYRLKLVVAIAAARRATYESARPAFDQAEALARGLQDTFLQSELRHWRGQSLSWSGRPREALEDLQIAASGWLAMDNKAMTLLTLYEVATAYRDIRNAGAAITIYDMLRARRKSGADNERSESEYNRATQALVSALIVRAEEAPSEEERNEALDRADKLAEETIRECEKTDKYRATMALINRSESAILRAEFQRLAALPKTNQADEEIVRQVSLADHYLDRAIALQADAMKVDALRLQGVNRSPGLFSRLIGPLTNAVKSGEDPYELNVGFEHVRIAQLAFRVDGLRDPESSANRLRQTANIFAWRRNPTYETRTRILAAQSFVFAAAKFEDPQDALRRRRALDEADAELHRSYRTAASLGMTLGVQLMKRVGGAVEKMRASVTEAAPASKARLAAATRAGPETNELVQLIGRIAPGARIATRGIETAWLGSHLSTQASVIVKIYDLDRLDPRYGAARADGSKPLEEELNALAGLPDSSRIIDGIPRFLDVERPAGWPAQRLVLVSEIAQGRPLRHYMPPPQEASHGALTIRDENTILTIVYRLAETMRQLHLAGIPCCMVTPTAVMIEPGLRPVIVSFGYVQRGGPSLADDLQSDWYAPYCPKGALERVERSGPPDASWDVYTLGVLLAQWLLGKPTIRVAPGDFASGWLGAAREFATLAPDLRPDLRALIFDLCNCVTGKGEVRDMGAAASRIQKLINY